MTVDMGLAAAGLAFGIIGTLGFVIVSITCCVLWQRSRREFLLLKHEVERGSHRASNLADPNLVPIVPPTSDPAPSSEPVATTQLPSSRSSESRGYSSVNKLSLLPDEMRTAANLEGEMLPADREEELMEQYKKERADYEEQQLKKMNELKAQRAKGGECEEDVATPPASQTTPPKKDVVRGTGGDGYELVEVEVLGKVAVVGGAKGARRVDPYEDPADAITGEAGKVGVAKKTPPTAQKKLWSVGGSGDAGEEYTPVFNTLEKGSAQPATTARANSDSTPPTGRSLQPATAPHTYENSPMPSPSKNSSSAEDSSPEHPTGGTGSSESPVTEQGSPKIKHDENRQSKRKPAKEVVEFDPNQQKKFRMSSSIKKPKRAGRTDSKKAEETDGDTAGRSEALAPQSEDAPQNKSEAAPQAETPVKTFDIGDETQGLLSYAVVNMVDKKKNRLESDVGKIEGSGVPQRYRVPVATS